MTEVWGSWREYRAQGLSEPPWPGYRGAMLVWQMCGRHVLGACCIDKHPTQSLFPVACGCSFVSCWQCNYWHCGRSAGSKLAARNLVLPLSEMWVWFRWRQWCFTKAPPTHKRHVRTSKYPSFSRETPGRALSLAPPFLLPWLPGHWFSRSSGKEVVITVPLSFPEGSK